MILMTRITEVRPLSSSDFKTSSAISRALVQNYELFGISRRAPLLSESECAADEIKNRSTGVHTGILLFLFPTNKILFIVAQVNC